MEGFMSCRSHSRRSIARRVSAAAGVLGLGAGLLAGTAILAAAPASAIPIPPSTSSCTYNGSPLGFGASNTAGTPVTVSCTGLPPSTLLIVAQTSPLAGVISPSSAATSEADLSTGMAVMTDGSGNLSATITVTATGGTPAFSALDKKAVCPPTQAQVNAGLTNCVVTVADLATTTGLNFGNIIYGTQPTPHRPTLALTPSSIGKGGGTLTASDKAGACPTPVKATSRCWWGAALTGAPNAAAGVPGFTTPIHSLPASNTLAASPAVYCFKAATAAACSGLPVGTLIGPHLSGTITLPRLGPVAKQEVVALEPNTVPDPGNGPANTVRARAFVCVTSAALTQC
jgi:hypothetical protein